MYILQVILVLSYCGLIRAPPGHASVTCLHCSGVKDTSSCHSYVKCHHEEVCRAEAKLTNGHIVYNLGCSAPDHCHVGKRSTTLCRHCCSSSSSCHRHSCDQRSTLPATTAQPGMRCLQCRHVRDVNQCKEYTTCRSGQVCSTEAMNYHGETRYTLGCLTQSTCHSYQHSGKRFLFDTAKCVFCCSDSSTCARSYCQPHTTLPTQPLTTSTTTTTTTMPTTTTTTSAPLSTMNCLICHNVDDVSKCTSYQTCQPGDECSTLVTSVDGQLRYSFSCLSAESCQHLAYMVNTRAGRRETNTLKCSQCCTTHQACNSKLCSQFTMLPTTSSPKPSTTPTPTSTTVKTTAKMTSKPTTLKPTPIDITTSYPAPEKTTTTILVDPHCRDHEEDGFYCGSFDIFQFCYDTASFAHALALEKCAKHCGFCTPDQGYLIGYTPPDIPVHSVDLCLDYEQDGFKCLNYDHLHFCTDPSSIAYVVAHEKCRKHCGFCTDGHGSHVTPTKPTPVPTQTQTTPESACVDHEQSGVTCAVLDAIDICHNSIGHELCRKHCGFCSPDGYTLSTHEVKTATTKESVMSTVTTAFKVPTKPTTT